MDACLAKSYLQTPRLLHKQVRRLEVAMYNVRRARVQVSAVVAGKFGSSPVSKPADPSHPTDHCWHLSSRRGNKQAPTLTTCQTQRPAPARQRRARTAGVQVAGQNKALRGFKRTRATCLSGVVVREPAGWACQCTVALHSCNAHHFQPALPGEHAGKSRVLLCTHQDSRQGATRAVLCMCKRAS